VKELSVAGLDLVHLLYFKSPFVVLVGFQTDALTHLLHLHLEFLDRVELKQVLLFIVEFGHVLQDKLGREWVLRASLRLLAQFLVVSCFKELPKLQDVGKVALKCLVKFVHVVAFQGFGQFLTEKLTCVNRMK